MSSYDDPRAGFPSVGKSTLLTQLTGTESEAAAYEFTTLTCIPGVIHYNDSKIQLLDLPGIIEGAAQGKGRGRQVRGRAAEGDAGRQAAGRQAGWHVLCCAVWGGGAASPGWCGEQGIGAAASGPHSLLSCAPSAGPTAARCRCCLTLCPSAQCAWQVIAVCKSADLLLMVLDATKPWFHRDILTR